MPNTEEPGATSSAEKILKKISSKVDVLSAKGTGIVTFSQVSVKTPRGRYDLEIFPNFMRMKGTQSSTISYETITRLTYLKSADEKDFIVIVRFSHVPFSLRSFLFTFPSSFPVPRSVWTLLSAEVTPVTLIF